MENTTKTQNYQRAYYLANRKRILERRKAHYAEHKEEKLEYSRQWHKDHYIHIKKFKVDYIVGNFEVRSKVVRAYTISEAAVKIKRFKVVRVEEVTD